MAVLTLGCFAVQFSLVCLPGLDSLVKVLHAGLHVKAMSDHCTACMLQDSSLSLCQSNSKCWSPTGVEMFKKSLSEGQAGDNVGLLLRRIQRDDVVRGQVVCKPGSVTPHQKFKGEIYALTKEEGGRHTPFFTNYKPQFFFRTADITGTATCCTSFSLLTVITHLPAVCAVS